MDEEWISSSSSVESYSPEEIDEEYYKMQLNETDLPEFLKGEIGQRNPVAAGTFVSRAAYFLSWFRKAIKTMEYNVYTLLHDFITSNYQMLPRYYRHLIGILMLKASTIVNYNEDLLVLFNWFAVYRSNRDTVYSLGPESLFATNLVVVAMRKLYNKLRRRETLSGSTSIEDLTRDRKWPAGGVQQLYDAVLKELPWLQQLLADSEGTIPKV
jgi:hypothetical protein